MYVIYNQVNVPALFYNCHIVFKCTALFGELVSLYRWLFEIQNVHDYYEFMLVHHVLECNRAEQFIAHQRHDVILRDLIGFQ